MVIFTSAIYFLHVNRRVIPRGGTRMTNEPEKWSSLEEIAEHLGVSKDTIRNWIKKSVIPYRKIGRQYKFKISEVDAWVDSGKSADIE
jgi:excisionase family DNA binding protein